MPSFASAAQAGRPPSSGGKDRMDATHENAEHAISNTILIVDDEDINREILANLFEG